MRADGISRFLLGILISLFSWPCILISQTATPISSRPLAEDSVKHRQSPSRMPLSVLGNLPLQFEENKGQADNKALFLARGSGYTLFLNSDGLALNLSHTPNSTARSVFMDLLGTQPVEPFGQEQTATRTNYYLGSNPRNWHLAVPSYRSVVYREIYRGIDLIYHGSGSQLEYDFVVSPGSDPAQIRMRFEGLKPLLQGKDLSFEGQDQLSVRALDAFQILDGKKKAVEVGWEVTGDQASVHLGQYDHRYELIIDPIFFYGTYIGGNGADDAVSIVNGAEQGLYYVALSTSSAKLEEPEKNTNVSNPNCSGSTCGTDTLILEIQATTTDIPVWGAKSAQGPVTIVYPTVLSATYLGGNTGTTKPISITADNQFNVYVTGSTTNPNGLPPLGTKICSQSCTGYVAKLDSSLTLVYSLALTPVGSGVAVDSAGDIYITGSAMAGSLTIPPADLAFQQLVTSGSALTSGTHAYLLELGPTGALLFSSFIGGSGTDEGKGVAVSSNPITVYLTGVTSSTDFPTKCTACQTSFGGGAGDAFVLAISDLPSAPALDYSIYLGGSGNDSASSIAVDSAKDVVLVGSTTSTNFPNIPPSAATPPPFQFARPTQVDDNGNFTNPVLVMLPVSFPAGSQDGFVTSLSPDGTLRFTNFLGGTASTDSITSANAVALDQVGVIYVTGTSNARIQTDQFDSSTDFLKSTPPSVRPPNEATELGGAATTDNWARDNPAPDLGYNVFLAQIDPSGQNLLQATIAGGGGNDQGKSLSVAGYCFSFPPNPPNPPNPPPPALPPVYPPCVGTASIVGSTDDASQDTGLFHAASVTTLYSINPPSPMKLVPPPPPPPPATGFFVQEELAGYCNMQLQQQLESSLTLTGQCVSGTSSGIVYVNDKNGDLATTANVMMNGVASLTPSGTVTLDLSGSNGKAGPPFTLTFSFLPIGAIGAVGSCELSGDGFPSGCPIVQTGGGGAGTLFNVPAGTLTVVVSCPGTECTYNNTPDTVLVGQPVTLNADVINGVPRTVFWSSSGGAFRGPNPSTSITFTPGGSGGPVVVSATPVVDPSLTPVPSITLSTVNSGGNGGPLSIISSAAQLVAGTYFQFRASSPVSWTASAGTIDSSSGLFTAPNPPPALAQITITATSTANPQIFVTTKVTIVPVPAIIVPANNTLPAGGSITIPISITAGTGIAGESMTLECTAATLPTGVNCSFTPNPVINAGGAAVTLQLFSNNLSSNLPTRGSPWEKHPLEGSAIVITGCAFLIGCKNYSGKKILLLASALASAALLSLAACGTSGSFNSVGSSGGHVTGTYTINIAVSGPTPGAADPYQTLTTVPLKVTIQ